MSLLKLCNNCGYTLVCNLDVRYAKKQNKKTNQNKKEKNNPTSQTNLGVTQSIP